jgi:hypothetical protein
MAKDINVEIIKKIGLFYDKHSGITTLKDVIKLISGYDVLSFDENNGQDIAVLENLKKAADIAMINIQAEKIRSKRPNEVGNKIEAYVMNALINVGYNAHVPETTDGSHKSAGYPDIAFTDPTGRNMLTYVECKTYNHANIDTTQRSFYLSPSDDFKVTSDAYHFVISLEIVEVPGSRSGNGESEYTAVGWKILDIANLQMDLKMEFNSSNQKMYGEKYTHIIAESSSESSVESPSESTREEDGITNQPYLL